MAFARGLFLSLLLVSNLWAAPKKGVLISVDLSPAGSFEAKSKKVKGKIKKAGDSFSATNLSVSVRSLKTGMELRDDHLQKRLGGKKAKVLVSKATGQGGKGNADIKINGILKKLAFTYKVLSPKYIEVAFELKPSDFNIKDINYMGVGVKDRVKVKATLKYK